MVVGMLVLLLLVLLALGGLPVPRRLPAAAGDAARLAPREYATIAAAALATYPRGGAIPPSGLDAGVPAHVDRFVAAQRPATRLLMRLLFVLVEHATLLFPAPGRDGFRRFSALDAEQQVAFLRGWQRSALLPRRLVFVSLRAILTMGYLRDPGRAARARPRAARDGDAGVRGRPAVSADRRAEERDPPPAGRRARRRRRRCRSASRARCTPTTRSARVSGGVRVFAEYDRDLHEACDVVVVGSGPAAAVVAYERPRPART